MKTNTIASAGPDWITLTATSAEMSIALHEVARKWLDWYEEKGEIAKRWGAMGYQGLQCGHARCGVRGSDGYILILSGEDTGTLLEMVELPDVRVVRFDVQVTVSINPADRYVAKRLYDRMAGDKEVYHNAPDVRYVSSLTGDTVYIGKRGSPKFIRIYDKTFAYEEGKTGLFWRYEVEYKRQAANEAYKRWNASPSKEVWAVGIVAAEMKKRMVVPLFHPGTEIDAIEVKQSVSTPQGKLEWLSRCVSPVVAQLIELGYTEDLIHVLKLRHILRKE